MDCSTLLVITGLGIDILGAILIAFPDHPVLASKLKLGALREGKNKLDTGGVTRGETGFEEIEKILEGLEPVTEANEKPNENYVRISKNSRSGMAAAEAYEDPINWGDEYIEGFFAEENTYAYSDFYQVNPIYEEVRTQIRQQENRIRSTGFLLLAGGFLLQIIGNLI